jgi:hypothetical protein
VLIGFLSIVLAGLTAAFIETVYSVIVNRNGVVFMRKT